MLGVLGFVLSHVYRNFIRKNKWITFSTEKIIFYVIISSSLLSIIYNVVYFSILFFINTLPSPSITFSILWGAFISMFLLFALWNFFYFSWMYIEKSRKAQIESLKIDSMMKDIELKSLRANLQPHFIFNTLNNIRALINENPEQARDAITKMSNILRAIITKQNALDLFQNELNFVEDYLSLEKIRFEERLIFTKDIDEKCLTVNIPTMMLQTLIENAIKHGISHKEEGGEISLKAFLQEKFLYIQIENDIEKNAKTNSETQSLGFGLSSTKQRLKLIYRDNANFDFIKQTDKAIVNIKIPTD